jgi:hypothetical protein
MPTFGKSLIVGALLSAGFALSAGAADMTGAAAGDARTKVATAVALANIATSEKDGEALLVAARMLATAGPVAKAGEAVTDGKPMLYDVAGMAATAKEMGADAAKADEVAKMAVAPTAQARDGYWYYSCDSYNNCQWIYAGY